MRTSTYDTSSASAQKALAKRLGIKVDSLPAILKEAGFPPRVTLDDYDIAELQRELQPIDPEAAPLAKTVAQTYREAMRRCRQHLPLVGEARHQLFGENRAPFSGRIELAREWIEAELRKIYPDGPPRPPLGASDILVLSWPGKGDWHAYAWIQGDGPLAHLASWSKRLAQEAVVMESQATAYLLTGSIVIAHWTH